MARKRTGSSKPPSNPPAPRTDGNAAEPSDLEVQVRLGLQAIDTYDYDLARTVLTDAFERSHGGAAAARALFSLMVDILGVDQEAIALGERLSDEALASPDVRHLLALAAARSGDRNRARAHLPWLEGAAAADVLIILAEASLASNDLDEATQLGDEARSHAPAHPKLQELARRISRSRENKRRPLEEEIELFLAEGALDEARRLAEHTLSRFPDSTVARRALRASLEQEGTQEVERLLAEAEKALSLGDLRAVQSAVYAAQKTLGNLPSNEARNLRLSAIESEVAGRELDSKVREALGELGGNDLRMGLTRYTTLSAEARRMVREARKWEILDDLEILLERRVNRDDAVNAIIALGEASERADASPEDALQALATHERVLAGLGTASRVATQIRLRIQEKRRRRNSDVLTLARAALDRGDTAIALELLGELRPREMEQDDREVVDELRASAQRMIEIRSMEALYSRLMQGGDPLGAREVAERLLARASDAELLIRNIQLKSADQAVHREFGVWVLRSDNDAATEQEVRNAVELGVPLSLTACTNDTLPWLDTKGRSVIVVECCNRWIFGHEIDLELSRVRSRAVIRAPEPMENVTTTVTPEKSIVITSESGATIEISLKNWEPRLWRPTTDIIGSEELVGAMKLAPGGRFAWIHQVPHRRPSQGRTRVLDLGRRRVVRDLATGWSFKPVFGSVESLMVHLKTNATLSLHHPGGAPVDGSNVAFPWILRCSLSHPNSGKLLAFVGQRGAPDTTFGFTEQGDTGDFSKPIWLDAAAPTRRWACATSLAHQASFLVTYGEGDSVWLHTFRPRHLDGTVERVHKTRAPTFAWLAHDFSSENVVALVPDYERLHIVPLGGEPPEFPPCTQDPEYNELIDGIHLCSSNHVTQEFSEQSVTIHAMTEREATTWMHNQFSMFGSDYAKLIDVYELLRLASKPQVAGQLLDLMKTSRPSDPNVAFLQVEPHVSAKRWSAVCKLLDNKDLRAIDARRRQHAHHLLGLALFQTGQVERALMILEQGCKIEGTCRISTLLDIMGAMGVVHAESTTAHSWIRTLSAAIAEADECLSRNDVSGARAAIDRREVWNSGEVQSLARLVDVELREESLDDLGKFRKALALARFLGAIRAHFKRRRELPLPGNGWEAERLTELERAAQSWLDRLGGAKANSDLGFTSERVPEPDANPTAAGVTSAPGDDPTSAEVAPEPTLAEANSGPGDVATQTGATLEIAENPPETWRLALQEFDAALDELSPDESIRASARLAFRVRHQGRRFEGLDVYVQRALRGGRFSAGQIADIGQIAASPELLGDEADAAAAIVLTEGFLQRSRSLSRARLLRLLGTLVGHPRVFLDAHHDDLAKVQHARLGLELSDTEGGLALYFIVGGARWTADELLAHTESSVAIDVDADAHIVTLAQLGAAEMALIQVLARHRPIFPQESHDELRKRLRAVQHVVDLRLPDAFIGEKIKADSRPVVRLTPLDDGGLFVEIGVRPVPGAVLGTPGEGPLLALGVVGEARVSGRRYLTAERENAERIVALFMREGAARDGRWRFRLTSENSILAALEGLAELGDEVAVEWPKDVRAWRVGRATTKELRVRIHHGGELLSVEGGLEIDGHRVALAVLLEAIALGRRYVPIGPQRFIAIAEDLRERLAAARELIYEGRGALLAGLAATPVLADLVNEDVSDMAWRAHRERTAAASAIEPAIPAGLCADLRPYQREGFQWLVRLSSWATGACLADDMGLGKTLQALALIAHRAPQGPALVIAPISVTPGWISEAARFVPGLRVRIYRGENRAAMLADARPGDLFVAGYGVVSRDADALGAVHFVTLVLDEAHMIKNAVTRRARAVMRLRADFRLALTGTPVENHLGELWSLFRVITPGLLGTWQQFRERFAAPIERDQNAERRGALSRVLRPFLLRRTKESVLPELPPRIEVDRLVSLSSAERELYETARFAATTMIAEPDSPSQRFAILGWLTRLRRLACHPRLVNEAWTGTSSKLESFLSLVDELREAGHRALVFSQFTDQLAIIREALALRRVSVVYLDGSTPIDERARAVEQFQSGVGDCFLISLKAGGTGLNLTAANYVIHLDPWWNPAVEDQATDRAHRIGQALPVTVIRLIAEGTIEEAVLAMHAQKRELADQLLDGTDVVGRMSTDELIDLVRKGAPREDDVVFAESDDEDDRRLVEGDSPL